MNDTFEIKDFVGVFHNVFSEEYCDNAIALFEQASSNGYTRTRQDIETVSKSKKDDLTLFSCANLTDIGSDHLGTSVHLEFNKTFWGVVYPKYAEKYWVIEESDKHNIYMNRLQKTEIGQGYHVWHFENAGRTVAQRLLTYVVYLNDVEEGGETEFLYYPRRIKPQKGTLVLWPAGFTHTHRGNPPISNVKYILTGWVEY